MSQVAIRPRGRPSGRFFLSSLIANESGAGGGVDMTSQQPANMSLSHLAASQSNGVNQQHTSDIPQATDLRLRTGGELSLAGVNGVMVPADLALESPPGLSDKETNDDEAATDLSMSGHRSVTSLQRENDGNMSTPELQPVGFDNKVR